MVSKKYPKLLKSYKTRYSKSKILPSWTVDKDYLLHMHLHKSESFLTSSNFTKISLSFGYLRNLGVRGNNERNTASLQQSLFTPITIAKEVFRSEKKKI